MTHENDIPEYALQPARAPVVTPAEAIYHTEKIVYPAEAQTVTYEFEEDILVPDIKPDMQDILLMHASCDITPAEKKVVPKTDDLLNFTGNLTVQTLYSAEGSREPVAITSKVPYKYQWSLNPQDEGEGVFDCKVRSLESMIVNERKFRIKVTLEFSARLLCSRQFQFFDGLKSGELEMRRQTAGLTCLELVKKDETLIDETFRCKEAELAPEAILKQDFVIAENYRQVTTEKVVINGFVFCSVLYSAADAESQDEKSIHQLSHRVEFTQFVPIEKEHRGKNWNSVRTSFSSQDLTVVIGSDEENPEDIHFRIRGSVRSRIELYGNRQHEITTDAYHRDKNFVCDFSKCRITNFVGDAMAETSVREIINLPEGAKAAEAVYASAQVLDYACHCEKGRVVVSGVLSCCALWKDQNGAFAAVKAAPDFRGTVEMESAAADQRAFCRPLIKNAWVEFINEKQIEVNVVLLLCVQTCREEQITMMENPRFEEAVREKEYPMVIVTMKQGQCLWDLAKRYRTTEEHLRMANRLEAEPEPGRRLLIVK